ILGEVLLRSSLTQNSRCDISMRFSLFAIPMAAEKLRILSGEYPLLLNPEIVGILGSSQEVTIPFSTNCASFLLLTTEWLRFLLANSRCLGLSSPSLLIFSKNQL